MNGKSLVIVYYDYSVRHDGKYKPKYKTITRIVTAATVEEIHNGLPYKFYKDDSIKWAENLTWTLYRGTMRYGGEKHPVWGWSFNDDPPLVWGCNLVLHRIRTPSERIPMWNWQRLHDWLEYEANPNQLDISGTLRKHKIIVGIKPTGEIIWP